jgi:hypothetical protein
VSASRRSLLAPALALAALCSILQVSTRASAQDRAADEAAEEERAGHARGGSYAWGDSSTDDVPSRSGPATHRYGRVFGTVGAGITIRVLEYQPLAQSRLAPPYLQLRAGYFFEGDGDVQHGVGLGISTNLTIDGGADTGDSINGLDALAAWTFTPQYLLRGWFGDWFQLIGRVGVSVTASTLPNWGFEVGVHPLLKILSGFGFYADVSFSMFFSGEPSADIHTLISIEGGVALDFELLP